jgi:hypothetical protein
VTHIESESEDVTRKATLALIFILLVPELNIHSEDPDEHAFPFSPSTDSLRKEDGRRRKGQHGTAEAMVCFNTS